jgi:hypothetical protein
MYSSVDTRFFGYDSLNVYNNITLDTTQTVKYGEAYNLLVSASGPFKFKVKLGWTGGAIYSIYFNGRIIM